VRAGQPVELTFKFAPGNVVTGKVQSVLQAISTGQVQASGSAVLPKGLQALPFAVRVTLDDASFAERLPAGSIGEAAIFTERVKVAHVIRKVILRQIAILNYVNPF
jgi:multidrug resistance efflux pump